MSAMVCARRQVWPWCEEPIRCDFGGETDRFDEDEDAPFGGETEAPRLFPVMASPRPRTSETDCLRDFGGLGARLWDNGDRIATFGRKGLKLSLSGELVPKLTRPLGGGAPACREWTEDASLGARKVLQLSANFSCSG